MNPAFAPYDPSTSDAPVSSADAQPKSGTSHEDRPPTETIGFSATSQDPGWGRESTTSVPSKPFHDQALRLSLPGRRVSNGRVLLALNQLAVMCSNGVEIAEAIGSVAKGCRDEKLAASLTKIHDAVSQGSSFSSAVATYGTFFPSTLAPMLCAAEASGEVPQTLTQSCERMRGEMEMRGAILSAMIYPLILIAASSVVMSALIVGVLPQFSKVFASIGKPIPQSTQYLLSLGDFCRSYWMIILPVLLGILTLLVLFRKHPVIRRPIGRLLMYGPLIREAYRPLVAGRNFRTISAMIRGGVPLLQTVRLARRTTRDLYWQELLRRVEANLIDGLQASSVMARAEFLPPEAAQMMATAERTGRIGEVLEDIGTFYEQEVARRIKRLVIAFEPVIILMMGVVVAGVVMSVMLPLLDVSTVQR